MKSLFIFLLIMTSLPLLKAESFSGIKKQQVQAFKNNKMDRFFGYDLYIKAMSPEENKNADRLLVNILAYSKLCQFQKAERVLLKLKKQVLNESQLKKKRLVGEYLKTYRDLYPEALRFKEVESKTRKKYAWKITKAQLLKISNPSRLRLKVRNLCK